MFCRLILIKLGSRPRSSQRCIIHPYVRSLGCQFVTAPQGPTTAWSRPVTLILPVSRPCSLQRSLLCLCVQPYFGRLATLSSRSKVAPSCRLTLITPALHPRVSQRYLPDPCASSLSPGAVTPTSYPILEYFHHPPRLPNVSRLSLSQHSS